MLCVYSVADAANSWRRFRYLRHRRSFGNILSSSVSLTVLDCITFPSQNCSLRILSLGVGDIVYSVYFFTFTSGKIFYIRQSPLFKHSTI